MKKYDAIVIGTGQAGIPLAEKYSKEGKTIALIEKNKIGGTCVNDGCTPTKAYVACARRAYVAKNSDDFGVKTENVKIDLKTIKKRKDKMVEESVSNVLGRFEELEGVEVYRGEGSFVNERVIEITSENGEKEQIKADKIFINVGTTSVIPEEYKEIDFLTNTSILELEEIPEHLIVMGAGYIGLEFGQMFARFGSTVTVLDTSERFLEKEDKDIAKEVKKTLEKEDIKIHINIKDPKPTQHSKNKIEINFQKEGKKHSIKGSHLLLAVGRKPNTDKLNLDEIGVKADDKGYVKVNEHLQTSKSHIFAVGDCNGEGAFTHTTGHDAKVAKNFIFGDKEEKLSDRVMCYAMFIDPPLSRVGMNEEQAKEKMKEDSSFKVLQTTRPMSKVARATEKGETDGMMKILVDAKTEKIVGATLYGISADEVIHCIIDTMYADKSYRTILNAVHIHPTVSELIPSMLGELEELK